MKKYEFRGERIYCTLRDRFVYRIYSLRDFGNIRCGDSGGLVESENNLSHVGDCWIYDTITVCGHSVVQENAIIKGSGVIYGNCKIKGNAIVTLDYTSIGKMPRLRDILLDHGYWKCVKRNGHQYLLSNTLEMVRI